MDVEMKRLNFLAVLGLLTCMQGFGQARVQLSQVEERNINGESVIFVDDRRYDGIVYENYQVKKLEYTVKDGKRNGPYELYYPNGQLRRKTFFLNDQYDGPYEEFYDNGQQSIKTSFKNGKYDGALIRYYPDGTIQATGNHREGVFEGLQETY